MKVLPPLFVLLLTAFGSSPFGWGAEVMTGPSPKALLKKEAHKNVKKNRVVKTEEEWHKALTPEQFRVMRKKGTEPPFSGAYHKLKDKGIYVCAGCGTELFGWDAKFDSGTGWPSFTSPINPENVRMEEDTSLFAGRIEVLCSVCDAHLGHVFDDGPAPTYKRYCINSASLKFTQKR